MKSAFIRNVLTDFVFSLSFFSRLPVHDLYHDVRSFSLARSIWVWPLVSVLIGGLEGSVLYLLSLTALSPWMVAFLGLGFHLLLTGGLHEDGLADCADGFGGGIDRSQKLTIMKDSRLGTFGVLTLFVILGLQIGSLISLIPLYQKIIPLLAIIAMLSRTAMIMPIFLLNPMHSSKMTSQFSHIPILSMILHIGFSLGLCFLFLPWQLSCLLLAFTFFVGCGSSLMIHHQIKEYNGDSLGATQAITATVLLGISTLVVIP